MRRGKLGRVRFVTLGAERSDLIHFQNTVIGAMGTMTGGAFLGGGGMRGPVPPIFGHLAMTPQTEGRLPLFHKGRVGRSMPAVTGTAFQINNRRMLILVALRGRLRILMAGITDKSRPSLHQFPLIGAMYPVAIQAIAVSEGGMGLFTGHFGRQGLVTTQAQLPFGQRLFEQTSTRAAMGIVAGTAGAATERLVGGEAAQFRPSLLVTIETEVVLGFGQQVLPFRFMGGMAVGATAVPSRRMDPLPIGIIRPVMTLIAKSRGFFLQQSLPGAAMTAVTTQTLPLTKGRMNTAAAVLLRLMAGSADLARRSGQHAGIVAAVNRMAGLTFPFLDRIMLRTVLGVLVTVQTEAAGNLFDGNGFALNLMAFVAVPIFHGLMDDFLEQPLAVGTVLGMTIDTLGGHRIIPVAVPETAGLDIMAGGAKRIGFHAQ